MAPIAEDNTGRVFVDYKANGREHTVSFRYAGAGAPSAGFLTQVSGLMEDVNFAMPSDYTLIGASYASQGTNVRLPITVDGTGFAGAQGLNAGAAPAYLTAVGRSLEGRRWRAFWLGVTYNATLVGGVTTDYRVTAAENANVATLVADLTASDVVAIDAADISYYSYVNLGFNAHWQKAVRS